MRKLGVNIKFVATVLLSVTLLVGITGLQMHYHHCDTSGNTEHLFSLAFMGDDFSEEDFHCHCKGPDINTYNCESCTIDNHSHDHASDEDCCESGNELFKLNLEYILKSTKKIEAPKTLELFSIASVLLFDNIADHVEGNSITRIDPPPIPIFFGKQFIISSHQLKIPSA
jgi:hypothetical protein